MRKRDMLVGQFCSTLRNAFVTCFSSPRYAAKQITFAASINRAHAGIETRYVRVGYLVSTLINKNYEKAQ